MTAGLAHARNSGAASTDTEFLAIVDADDLRPPSRSHCNVKYRYVVTDNRTVLVDHPAASTSRCVESGMG